MPAWASRETRGALWCCKLLCADFFASDPGGGFEVFHERAFSFGPHLKGAPVAST